VRRDQRPLTASAWEYIAPLLGSASLVLSCVGVSSKKYFWNDELLSYFLLADPSFQHMMAALGDTINNAPPLYFALGWIWTKLFSSSELSLRLFSSLGICAALVITWLNLRRTYSFWPVSIATLSVFCLSGIILQQNAEARYYGLFLAVSALALYDYGRLSSATSDARRFSPATVVTHALMVYTHPFGFLYSGVILLALILHDRWVGIARPSVYLSVLVGWLSFLLWLGPFLNQTALGRPRSWIPPATLRDVIDALTLPRDLFLLLLPLSILIFWRSTSDRSSSTPRLGLSSGESSLLLVAYGFLGVPLLTWLLSVIFQPLFVARYLMPTLLGWCTVLAALLARLPLPAGVPADTFRPPFRVLRATPVLILTVLTATMLLAPLQFARGFPRTELTPLGGEQQAGAGLPIAFEFSQTFLQRFHYSRDRDRYVFILDSDAALDGHSGLFSPGEYKTMEALRRNYPALFRDRIVDGADFLRRHRRFLVLDYGAGCTSSNVVCPQWFELRIAKNEKYSARRLGSVDGMDLVLVEAVE
jgi:hypothetical protein